MSEQFLCIALAPAVFGEAGVAIAAARAGGVGILDLTGAPADAAAKACEALAREGGQIGLRAADVDSTVLAQQLALLGERAHWLIVSAADNGLTVGRLAELASPHRRLLVEITDAGQLDAVERAPIDGLILRGHESGGWVGEDTAFILLQKVVRRVDRPVYVNGSLGLHAAAACRAAGAAGIVLDDQLLLMPESPLPADWKRRLAQVGGKDAKALGEMSGAPCRVLLRPDLPGAGRLQLLADECDAQEDGQARWLSEAPAMVGWGDPKTHAWPIGQGIGLAGPYYDRFKTTGRLIEAITRRSGELIETARRLRPLGADSALAEAHRTRFPIVQGPMTRVSDSAAFADAVSKGGGLPFLALALMTGEQTEKLLRETAALLGERSWGVGLLGFAPGEIREAQIRAIFEVRPPFALVAGGRPDQAAQFEAQGISTYIHAPAPELLELFLDQGARKFVFEGRECGGHIGPLASFVLWESQIELLLRKVPAKDAASVHVLFAGGIHDDLSAAMIAVMTAPLVERGMKVGVLVGTGYLFTDEIVASGAVVPEFRAQALACRHTVNVVSGPGHATRCVNTEFAREFFAERRRLLRDGEPADAVRDRLEDFNLGRLRLASKGIVRDRERGLIEVPVEQQRCDGMYMIGQAATLRAETTTIADLHAAISDGSVARLADRPVTRAAVAVQAKPADIAIIGIGTLLPNALTPEDFWSNILGKVDCITEVPKSRFDWRLYFDADRHAKDKIYAKWGGFIGEVPFDPLRYGIPPRSLASIDPIQLLTLEVVRRALEDAGYADGDFDRENTSVILGAGGGLADFGLQYGVRAELPRTVGKTQDAAWDRLPEWTEESFAGSLLNVAAGRVANRFNFGGLNFTIDAACSSALAAVGLAAQELETGRSNVVIAGGIDVTQGPFAYLSFCKTQALSPTGRIRAFDKHADGIVISEGLAVLVMKRLADAEAAGDRIYAVIKSVAGSSDGRALGLTAPRPEGQVRALNRAYAKAGFGADTIGLMEAHGTGTTVGDKAELETIIGTLDRAGAGPQQCAVGSVKTLIGHLKAGAGAAGLVKTALALHHRTLPPHTNVTEPLDAITRPDSPVYLLKEAKPWLTDGDRPRRAAVSAFGFGGTNFHAVLEEYRQEYRSGADTPGADRWPYELFLFRGRDKADLKREIEHVRAALVDGATPRLRDLALTLALRAEQRAAGAASASVVAPSLAELVTGLESVISAIDAGSTPLPRHVSLCLERPEAPPKVALLFPGQGSQYVNMGREQALYLSAFRRALEAADRSLDGKLQRRLTDYLFPPADFTEEAEAASRAALTATEVAQPAIGTISAAYLDVMRELGLEADMAAGHSYGEFTALHAASALSRADFLALSAARGQVMSAACNAPERGAMAAISALREQVEPMLADIAGVVVANHNAPKQVVISGTEAGVRQAVEKFAAAGIDARLLPVAGAFHSPLMAPSKDGLVRAIGQSAIEAPGIPVYANATGKPYPAEAVRQQLGEHMLSSVEFVSQIEQMYADGARVFLELGPKSVLSGLAGLTLKDRPHLALSLDSGGLRGSLMGLGALFTQGVKLHLTQLFEEREAQAFEIDDLASRRQPAPSWYVSGGWARAATEPVGHHGRIPTLTLETYDEEQVQKPTRNPAPTPGSNTEVNGAHLNGAHANGAAINGVAASHVPAATQAEVYVPPAVIPAAAPQPQPAYPAYVAPAAPTAPVMVAAFDAYQQTMRQFLAVQERVLTQFLGDGAVQPAMVEMPGAAAAVPQQPAMPRQVVPPPAPMPVPAVREPAPVQPIAAAPAPAQPPVGNMDAAVPREEVSRILLGLVAERTGYPAEMLGLDRDVEAELGIDSIKRVEILGGLQQRLPREMSARVSREMETLTRVKTLSGIIDQLVAAGANGHEAAVVAVPATAAPMPAGMPREEVVRILLGLVAERTGYPAEMLGLDRDVEAELGIDSIKRVEILGGLQQRMPPEMSARVSQEMETLTRVKTLSGIIDQLTAAGANGHEPGVIAVPAAAPLPAGMPREEVARILLGLVGERTGYPAEMLGLDRDVEAELGIDSIKRVEILGGLQQRMPPEMSARVSREMETLTRVKTLSGIIDRLVAAGGDDHAANGANAAAVVAVVPVLTAGMPREEVTRVLLGLVGERTGYPAEMLGLDRDVEAELGIDSIKRVEILGGLQQRLPPDMSAKVSQEMEALTRVKTLSGIVDRLVSPAIANGHAAPHAQLAGANGHAGANGPDSAVVASAAGMPREEVTRVLLGLVGERTGYPAEMLGLDRDVEAELGIDSIKRVEILGGLQQRLPTELSARVSQEMEALTRVKTLSGIIDRLLMQLATPVAAPAKKVTIASVRQAVNAPSPEPVARLSVAASKEALPEGAGRSLNGLVVITEDELSVAPRLARLLEERGAACNVIPRLQLLGGGEAIEAAIKQARAAGQKLTGVVHLASLAPGRAIGEAVDWRNANTIGAKGLFRVLHACAPDFADAAKNGGQFLVAASVLGGRYGRGDAAAMSAVPGGGAHGLLKVARKEWPGLRAVSLDFDAARDADEIAHQICGEILNQAEADEVGYPGGERTIFRPVLAPLAESGMPAVEPQADWVVLATGGARGITAELLHTVARPGMRLVLVGRSPLPGAEEADTRGLDGAELRKALLARAAAENAVRTPVAINRQVQQLLTDREIRRHMGRLGEIAAVEYRSADVRDIDAFGALIDDVYLTHGRIDAVLHGAGIIEDKLIRDKQADSFDRVLATKADSVFALARHLRPEALKLLVLFGSVAGRFGNPGQGDYAAANEVLNRMAWHLRHQWPATRIMAINWGPWADSGMASEAVQRELRARGIEPIATADGLDYFAQELRHGHPDDVELIIGTGPWVPPRGADAVPHVAVWPSANGKANGHAGHFLFDAPKLASDRSMTVEYEFDLDLHPYLADHRLAGVPVLPATAALEWMAQFVELAWPDWKVQAIDDLRMVQGIKLTKGEPAKVLFRARASSHADAESVKVSVDLASPDGKAVYYRGVATLMPELPPPARADIGDLAAGDSLDPERAYRDHLANGPELRLVDAIDRIHEQGVDAAVSSSCPESWLKASKCKCKGKPSKAPAWLFDPGVTDTAPQLAAVWSHLKGETTPLPSHIGGVERFGALSPGERLRLRLRVKANGSADHLLYDALFVDKDDRVRLVMRDVANTSGSGAGHDPGR